MKLEKVMDELGREIEEAIDSSKDEREVLYKTAGVLKGHYERYGASPIALFLTGMMTEYSSPSLVPFYMLRSLTVNDVQELFEKTIELDKDNSYFWENLASAILQHPVVIEAIKEREIFKQDDSHQKKSRDKKKEYLSDVEEL